MTQNPSEHFMSPDSAASSEAQQALEREQRLPLTGWQQEVTQGLAYGLEAADIAFPMLERYNCRTIIFDFNVDETILP